HDSSRTSSRAYRLPSAPPLKSEPWRGPGGLLDAGSSRENNGLRVESPKVARGVRPREDFKMPSLRATLDPIGAASLLVSRVNGTDTESLPKSHQTITTQASADRTLPAQNGMRTAHPRTGGQGMTLGVFQAVKGQRNVEDLLRAIPDDLRPLLFLARVILSLVLGASIDSRNSVLEWYA